LKKLVIIATAIFFMAGYTANAQMMGQNNMMQGGGMMQGGMMNQSQGGMMQNQNNQ
jgi:Spy/CpxP family protein refolding chaperone